MTDDTKAGPSLADELTQRMNAMGMNAGDQKTSVEDEKDARTADGKAARIAAAEVEAASIRAMMNRAVEAAPTLADRIAQALEAWPLDDMILRAAELQETLAALRAVEAVRAFPRKTESRWTATSPYGNGYVNGYSDAVEAVQALLTDVAVPQACDSATTAAHEKPIADYNIAPADAGHKPGLEPKNVVQADERCVYTYRDGGICGRPSRSFSHMRNGHAFVTAPSKAHLEGKR